MLAQMKSESDPERSKSVETGEEQKEGEGDGQTKVRVESIPEEGSKKEVPKAATLPKANPEKRKAGIFST